MAKWIIDGSHSSAGFSVKHLMVSTVRGRFAEVQGEIDFEPGQAGKDYVEATINAASVSTNDEKRDGHLKSPEFFEVEKYPTITFKSKKVEWAGQEEFVVTGDLTIRDVTKEVTMDVEYSGQSKSPFGDTRAGFSARTQINRKDFGLNWNVALEAGGVMVSDKVQIVLDVEAVLQTAPVPAGAA